MSESFQAPRTNLLTPPGLFFTDEVAAQVKYNVDLWFDKQPKLAADFALALSFDLGRGL